MLRVRVTRSLLQLQPVSESPDDLQQPLVGSEGEAPEMDGRRGDGETSHADERLVPRL